MTTEALTFEMIEQARARIGERIAVSPLAFAHNLSERTGTRLFLKLENLNITGSFKERGAANRLLRLSESERARGVVAASAGNHAQGVSLHATRLGIRARIFMPETTPLMKVTRTRRFGAEVVLAGTSYDEAAARARDAAEESGATFVHAFDDLDVMAGQGTVALEILEQNPYIDTIVVPIGGGGLISGVAVAIKQTNPRIRVIGVESEACTSMRDALAAGAPVLVPPRRTIAEGLAARQVGEHTFRAVRKFVDDVVTVSEEDIAGAILDFIEEEKVVAEGAAATTLAAVIAERIPSVKGHRTALVVSGGNIDTNLISLVIDRGLVKAGRLVRMQILVPDVPGALSRLTRVIGEERANILEINHSRAFSHGSLGDTDVTATLETRGFEHIERLTARIREEGFRILG